MSDWQAGVARAREEFIEALAHRGFRLAGNSLFGEVQVPVAGTRTIEVRIPDAFPYAVCQVRPTDGNADIAWHRDPDGWLCLYAANEHSSLPWADPNILLARTVQWFVQDLAGWPDDPPALDLERYIERAEGFVIYGGLDALVGRPIRAQRRSHGVVEVVGTGTAPKKHRGKYMFGWAEDLGELERPVRDWVGIAAILGDRASRLQREIEKGRGELLLLRYRRGPHAGALALRARPGSPVEIRAFRSADASPATLGLRAGADADILREKNVAVVGLGAVGSFLADLLARGGIARLRLVDGDDLRPGNSVRHLAGREYWGWNKAAAVADLLVRSGWIDRDRVTVMDDGLRYPAYAESLLLEHDVVVDATANGPTTSMLADIAAASGRPLVSVCIQREGDLMRADRWPLAAGQNHAPPVPAKATPQELRESGCGDPVSPAPPAAAVEAAALAWRVSCDLLTGRLLFPPSVVQTSVPEDGPPQVEVDSVA